jgi:hypothetical protein
MKMSGTLLAIAIGATVQVVAAPLPEHPSAASTTETNAVQSKLMSLQPAAKGRVEIQRVGNMSSRPWTEIVGWHPGMSQFPDAENHEAGLTLLSVHFGPQNRQQKIISRQSPQP